MNRAPIVRDLVLVGGGHSHALLLRRWGMSPLPGVRVTLVSRDTLTPYSGFLPGLLAGHQSFEETHIDLRSLCQWAGVRFIEANMTGIDLAAREVQLEARPAIGFDLLSLDTGSTPNLSVPGAAEFSTPVKPVHDFYARWQHILQRFDERSRPLDKMSIGVVGSGAGGFELIMAMRETLPAAQCDCHWFLRGERPLGDRSGKVADRALAAADKRGVLIHRGFDVTGVDEQGVHAADGRSVHLDETLWCTGATGPAWPAAVGLDTDDRGFVLTNAHLQSTSHEFVFASGDIGTQRDTPNAKAGVFAVRQAPVLFENLRRMLLKKPLQRYVPQRDFLTLMITGDRNAIGSRGPLVFEGAWVWRLKQRIDSKFMKLFSELPRMATSTLPALVPDVLRTDSGLPDNAMQCRGCGAKVGSAVLDRVLATLQPRHRDDIIQGFSAGADAAVFSTGGRAVVQSVDQISAIVDDPWVFGRIAALHALSDVVTLDAQPHSAQVLVSLSQASDKVQERELTQLMLGVLSVLNEEDCSLIGGHSAEGAETSLGLVVNALATEGAPVSKMLAGQQLVLTQCIGIGVLFAGLMQGKASGVEVSRALVEMQQSNRLAADVMRQQGAVSMTDITGFGLLEHLERLLAGRDLSARIMLDAVPVLPGAARLSQQGVSSSLLQRNQAVLESVDVDLDVSAAGLRLLSDPQTGGGLLAAVPVAFGKACVDALQAAGYRSACIIGEIVHEPRHRVASGLSLKPNRS